MATLYKRGNTYWLKWYVNGQAYYKSTGHAKKHLALREKQVLEAKLLESRSFAPRRRNLRVDEFWDEYLKWAQEHRRPKTVEEYEIVWRQLLEATKPKRMSDITPESLERFKAWKKERGNSLTTINNALRDIQSILSRGEKLGLYTDENPVMRVTKYNVTRKISRTAHSAADMDVLLEHALNEPDTNLRAIVLLGGYAGLRKNEILSARWEWFDWGARVIRVLEYPGFEIKDHEEREIPMHSKIIEHLKPLAEEAGPVIKERRRDAKEETEYVGYRTDPKKLLGNALKSCGLVSSRPFQTLRVSFGSIRAEKGVPVYKLKEWIGHASVTTTEKHYLHLSKGYDPDIE